MSEHAFDDEISSRILVIAQTMRRDLTQRAAIADLALTDFLTLRHLIRRGSALSPTEVALMLDCSRANATEIVKRLEAAGYIRATAACWAPKAKSLSITEAGRRACAGTMRQLGPGGRFHRLSPEERKELYRLLGLVMPKFREFRYVD